MKIFVNFVTFKLYFDVEMQKFSQSMFIPDQRRQTTADNIMILEVMFCSMTLLSLQVYVSGCCFINKGSFFCIYIPSICKNEALLCKLSESLME